MTATGHGRNADAGQEPLDEARGITTPVTYRSNENGLPNADRVLGIKGKRESVLVGIFRLRR